MLLNPNLKMKIFFSCEQIDSTMGEGFLFTHVLTLDHFISTRLYVVWLLLNKTTACNIFGVCVVQNMPSNAISKYFLLCCS